MIDEPKLEETGPEGPVLQLSELAAARTAAVITAIAATIAASTASAKNTVVAIATEARDQQNPNKPFAAVAA